jgi:hypothetical protein
VSRSAYAKKLQRDKGERKERQKCEGGRKSSTRSAEKIKAPKSKFQAPEKLQTGFTNLPEMVLDTKFFAIAKRGQHPITIFWFLHPQVVDFALYSG